MWRVEKNCNTKKYFLFCVTFLTVQVKSKLLRRVISNLLLLLIKQVRVPANICLFKFNDRKTKKLWNISKVNIKITRTTSMTSSWCFCCYLLTYFTLFNKVVGPQQTFHWRLLQQLARTFNGICSSKQI